LLLILSRKGEKAKILYQADVGFTVYEKRVVKGLFPEINPF
jgi:hypothetical protein